MAPFDIKMSSSHIFRDSELLLEKLCHNSANFFSTDVNHNEFFYHIYQNFYVILLSVHTLLSFLSTMTIILIDKIVKIRLKQKWRQLQIIIFVLIFCTITNKSEFLLKLVK